MYWPVGTPRIFATSSSHTPTFNLVVSHDGLPSPPPLRDDKPDHQSSLLPAAPTSSQDALGLPGALSPATPTTPITPATPATSPSSRATMTNPESMNHLPPCQSIFHGKSLCLPSASRGAASCSRLSRPRP